MTPTNGITCDVKPLIPVEFDLGGGDEIFLRNI
jgi:hypothetical protein